MVGIAVWKIQPDKTLLAPVRLEKATSLDVVSEQIPGGAYTTFRTFAGDQVMHFGSHITRLTETARLAGHSIKLDGLLLRQALRKALAEYPAAEKRVRVTLDLENHFGDLYITMETLHVPSDQEYRAGVAVITRQMKRNNPKAKLTAFIHTAGTLRQQLPRGVNETLMIDETGQVLEGLSSNFFAVRGGELWTSEEGVLSGITRSIVLEEARRLGLRVHLEGVQQADLARLDEAFITSASRGVLPVVLIDAQPVGDGLPGRVTNSLIARYRQHIAAEIEPV